MHFDQLSDIESRYVDTFILFNNEPYFVGSVDRYGSTIKFRVYRSRMADYINIEPYGVDKDACVLDLHCNYYAEYLNQVMFCSRRPMRQWKQGFRPNLYSSNTLQVKGESRRNELFTPSIDAFEAAKFWSNQKYVQVQDLTQHLERNNFAVIAKDLCVLKDGTLFYRDLDVGVVLRGEAVLHSEGSWVLPYIKAQGIPVNVRGRTRGLFNPKISLLELESILPEDLLQKVQEGLL